MGSNHFNTFKIGDMRQEWLHEDTLVRVEYDGTLWRLEIGFPMITPQEIEELKNGDVRATFTVIHDSLFLLFKIGAFGWMDAPYCPGLNVSSDPESFYREFPAGKGAALSLLIIDTSRGELMGMRLLGMGNRFSNRLHNVCREIVVPITIEENRRKVQEVYAEYDSAEAMLDTADINNIFLLMKHGF